MPNESLDAICDQIAENLPKLESNVDLLSDSKNFYRMLAELMAPNMLSSPSLIKVSMELMSTMMAISAFAFEVGIQYERNNYGNTNAD